MGTTALSFYKTEPPRPRAGAIPDRCILLCILSSPFFSDDDARQRRQTMSSSSSASQLKWTRYGPLSLGSCPDCPRTSPLKRLVTMSDNNDNAGCDFVKCESKADPGKVGSEFPLCQFRLFFLNFAFSSDLGIRVIFYFFRI
jgi:hypothetical protein